MEVRTYELYELTGLRRPEGASAHLTCYLPEGPRIAAVGRRTRPAVLILPGGGYEHCSSREGEPVALRFTARGWAAFVLEYSCAPLRFPVSLREAAAAMAYIRGRSGELGIGRDMAAAVGFSAGGHLCGMLGTMFDGPEVRDIAPAEDIRPDALGLCYPVAVSHGRTHRGSFENLTGGDEALARRLSLDGLVRPDMCPVFLWHTRDDGAVPCRGSLLTAAALEERGVPFAAHIYAHGRHGLSTADELVYPSFDLPETSADVPEWCAAMIRFFGDNGLRLRDREVK